MKRLSLLLFALVCLVLAQPLRAHSGPPFPIIDEQPIPGYRLSLWTDPDIGESTFFVVLEPDESQTRPAVAAVEITVEPVSGRRPKAVYPTVREDARTSLRFTAHPELDAQEMWRVDADLRFADGSTRHFTAQVEATPPGGGAWGLLFFIVPFLLFGGLWVLVFLRRARAAGGRARVGGPRCESVPTDKSILPPS